MEIRLAPPNEKQKLFLKDHHKHVAFGGARGGGKSYGIRMKAILLAMKWPGITIMIIRKSYPELRANHIKPLKALCRCGTPDAAAAYNDSNKEMTFPNGSTILFGYCNAESDVDRYQGTEVDVLFLDEATLLSEEQIKALVACVRGVNGFPKRIYYTCNPGGKSHQFIKRLFVDREFLPDEYPEEYSFIQSLVSDNKALMQSNPDYVRQLEALPEQLKKAWLYGDWNAFVGQVFELRNDPDHYKDHKGTHVIEPFPIPQHWTILMSMDWGYTKPFAFLWFALDEDGRMYCIREYYGCTNKPNTGVQMEPTSVAQAVKAIEQSDPNLMNRHIIRIGDPAIWGSQGTKSIGTLFEEQRIYIERADNDRLNGKMQCHNRLAFDHNDHPMFHVFDTCRHFIRTIPTLIYDEKHPEDVDTDGEDHIYDAWRYACQRYAITMPLKEPEKPKPYDPLDPLDDYYRTNDAGRYDFFRQY